MSEIKIFRSRRRDWEEKNGKQEKFERNILAEGKKWSDKIVRSNSRWISVMRRADPERKVLDNRNIQNSGSWEQPSTEGKLASSLFLFHHGTSFRWLLYCFHSEISHVLDHVSDFVASLSFSRYFFPIFFLFSLHFFFSFSVSLSFVALSLSLFLYFPFFLPLPSSPLP